MKRRKRLLQLATPLLQPLLKWYLRSPRIYRYKQIKVKVLPSVFHPGLFFSTKMLVNYVAGLSLQDLRVLELGAGSGLIALYCAKQGAKVTASDINPAAIEGLHVSSKLNKVTLDVIESNLFQKIIPNDFDLIIINPPYYPKDPQSAGEAAWFCGTHFQYFQKLFSELHDKLTRSDAQILMILS